MSTSRTTATELEEFRRSVAVLRAIAQHAPSRLRAALLDAVGDIDEHLRAVTGADIAAPDALEAEIDHLRALVQGKDVLLGAVAHELRVPLSAVLGYALTLERGVMVSEEERAVILGRLADRARAMSQTVDDLLDLDLFARGELTLRRERLDVGTLVRDALARARIDDRRIILEEGAVEASLDRARALRMIRALIEAAGALTPSPLQISVSGDEGVVAVVVASEPSDTAESGSPERARLALTLASTLAEIHAGRVSVSPREGGAVWLRLEVPRGI